MVNEELQGIIDEYDNGRHLLLAAGDLEEYAKKHQGQLDGRDYEICRRFAGEFIKRSMFDCARGLYVAFGMSEDELNILIIKEARRILGVEEKLEELKQKPI